MRIRESQRAMLVRREEVERKLGLWYLREGAERARALVFERKGPREGAEKRS